MASINLDLDYFGHPKTVKLVELLGRGADVLPLRLWCYCGKYHTESGLIPGDLLLQVEKFIGWWGVGGGAFAAMVEAGFLTKEAVGYQVHDWLEHSGHLSVFRRRAKAAARARWERVDASSSASSNASSSASSNASSNASPSNAQQESALEKGGVGEGGFPGELTAEWLARMWLNQLRRAPNRTEAIQDVSSFLGEMMAHGADPAAMRDEILSKTRKRTEVLWDFEKRLLPGAANGNGSERLGRLSRVAAEPRSIAAINKKTIRIGATAEVAQAPSHAGN